MVRERIATVGMSLARSLGRSLGCELVVETSDHSINLSMERPQTADRAWDHDLYQHGQLYYRGYANPIKPVVQPADSRDELDDVAVEEGETDAETPGSDGEDRERTVGLVPSTRWRMYLDQHLISELVRPEERWKLLVYGVLGVAGLQFITIIVIVYLMG